MVDDLFSSGTWNCEANDDDGMPLLAVDGSPNSAFAPITSCMPEDIFVPILCRRLLSSAPDRLARCFFIGLPTNLSLSMALSADSFAEGLLGGVASRALGAGGVVLAVGVADLEPLTVSGLLPISDSGPAECCRFN